MALNPLGLYYMTMFGEIHGQLTQNGFYFQTKSTSSQTSYTTEATQILSRFESAVLPKIKNFASDDWLVKSLLITTLIPAHTILIEKRIAVGSGIQPDDSLPSFCAGLLSLRTGIGGRSAHGRLYLPGVAEDGVSNSRVEGTNLTQLVSIGDELLASFGSATSALSSARYGVFSRKLGVTRVVDPIPRLVYSHAGFFPVTEIVARNEVASMRKRQLRHGQ